jgi:hypothetical protein
MIFDDDPSLYSTDGPIQVPFNGHVFVGIVANQSLGTIGGKGKTAGRTSPRQSSDPFPLAKLATTVKRKSRQAGRTRDRTASLVDARDGSSHRTREKPRETSTMYAPRGTRTSTNTFVARGRGQTLGQPPQDW